jgi:hypothetical protein
MTNEEIEEEKGDTPLTISSKEFLADFVVPDSLAEELLLKYGHHLKAAEK